MLLPCGVSISALLFILDVTDIWTHELSERFIMMVQGLEFKQVDSFSYSISACSRSHLPSSISLCCPNIAFCCRLARSKCTKAAPVLSSPSRQLPEEMLMIVFLTLFLKSKKMFVTEFKESRLNTLSFETELHCRRVFVR